jgi:hypothetical protein
MKMYAVVTLTNTVALQTDGPTPLIPKSGICHDPEPTQCMLMLSSHLIHGRPCECIPTNVNTKSCKSIPGPPTLAIPIGYHSD